MSWPKVPFLVWLTGLAAFAAANGDFEVLGFSVSGYAWLVPLVAALLVLARHPTRVRFPVWIWIPWGLLLLAYLTQAEEPHAMQRTVMMLCPLVVGMAASCVRATPAVALATLRFVRPLAVALLLGLVWGTGLLLSGTLPSYGGYAASVMTVSLLGAVFAAEYSSGRRVSLAWWAAIQLAPLIALARTGIVASALTLPLCLGRLRLRTRLISLGAIALGGIALFSSPRMQARMFYSGSGTFSDVSIQNRNFATSGRSALWPELVEEIKKRPLLGHGANASETYVSTTRPGLAHPHNDWLRLLYDHGALGTFLFVVTLLAQVFHALAAARRAPDPARVLFIGAASSFIVLAVFMLTDNIILYAAFFGNLQFALLGTAYGSTSRRMNVRSPAEPLGNHAISEHRTGINTNGKVARGPSDAFR